MTLQITRLRCSECEHGHYAVTDPRTVTCHICGDIRDIAWDVKRHINPSESLIIRDGFLCTASED